MTAPVRLVVTAAVIARGDTFLVTRRPRGAHLAGFWEFPGGKCEAGESLAACLRRELLEELGAGAVVGHELLAVTHHYPERSVELHFLACELTQDPVPLLGQEMRWVARRELGSLRFPPADDELIALLQRDER
jgi:8-oxo-dGTP diphosphatase